MAKILVYAGSCVHQNFSFIAPMRIIRACKRHGDEITLINWKDERVPAKLSKYGKQILKWGKCWTLSQEDMKKKFQEIMYNQRPDIVYSMGHSHIDFLINECSTFNVPLGIHVGDPYYAGYPQLGLILLYKQVDFITFNEGQAMNYLITKYPYLKDKCYLLNHAIDPELSPTLKQLKNTEKKYICSCVGGDDSIRRRELILYFYQWTVKFPNYKFALGGSLGKGGNVPYTENELISQLKEKNNDWNHTTFTLEEALKFRNKKFNLILIPHDLPYPLGLSHPSVHKLYSQSFYGFTPYGHYICKGWQSEFNMMTFGTKIFEMGGSGSAMIANKIKDLEKIIIQGETGFIFNKPKDAYTAFKLAVDKPKEVKQMGINAYNFIHKYHSWDNRYREVLLPIFKKLGIKK